MNKSYDQVSLSINFISSNLYKCTAQNNLRSGWACTITFSYLCDILWENLIKAHFLSIVYRECVGYKIFIKKYSKGL